MWSQEVSGDQGCAKFFRIITSHTDLANYFKLTHELVKLKIYTLSDLDDMVPYEIEIRGIMITQELQQELEERERLARSG